MLYVNLYCGIPFLRAMRTPVARDETQGGRRHGPDGGAVFAAAATYIAASLRQGQPERFLERVELKPSTAHSITEIPVLLREVAEITRGGIAYDDREFNLEVRCVAMPVKDFTGQIIGAVGIPSPVWRLPNHALKGHAKIAQAAAERPSVAGDDA
jgi:IclR family KDG regulon transcriptional repressor